MISENYHKQLEGHDGLDPMGVSKTLEPISLNLYSSWLFQ